LFCFLLVTEYPTSRNAGSLTIVVHFLQSLPGVYLGYHDTD
jgi:hypothetical protein